MRYRSYYYDSETELYYLNSRYYDPEVGRFINADDLSCVNKNEINGLNLYAYCVNNPINNIDKNGYSWFKNAWGKIKNFVKDLFTPVIVFVEGCVNTIGNIASGAINIASQSVLYNNILFSKENFFGGIQSGIEATFQSGFNNSLINFYTQTGSAGWKFWEYRIGFSVNISNYTLDFNVGLNGSDIEFSKGNLSLYWKVEPFKTKIGYSILTQGENGLIKNYTEAYLNLVRVAFAYLVITVLKGLPVPVYQKIFNYV